MGRDERWLKEGVPFLPKLAWGGGPLRASAVVEG